MMLGAGRGRTLSFNDFSISQCLRAERSPHPLHTGCSLAAAGHTTPWVTLRLTGANHIAQAHLCTLWLAQVCCPECLVEEGQGLG